MNVRASVLLGRAAPLRVRWGGVIAAVAVLGALTTIGLPQHAGAATNAYDQISGVGSTDSQITVPWSQGLLDNANQPISSPGTDPAPNAARSAGTGELSFMYSDFQNLQVTVSQTQDITHQGITVTWTGGAPTISTGLGAIAANYMQMMECYGDSSTGPDPTQCEYGSQGMLPVPTPLYIGQREGDLCPPGAVPSPPNGVPALNGDSVAIGCDPAESASFNPPHIAPCPGDDCSGTPPQSFSVPFVPADGSPPVYGHVDTAQYFNQASTDEVQEAVTNADGTGQQQFETLTGTEAPGLGCGEPESDGQPRGCWLVIVPRGQYEPNGYKINTAFSGAGAALQSSPLSAFNWAMRIQIHLDFAPIQAFCPIGTQERETAGTEVISRAVQSWQLALNKAANCSTIFGFSAVPEATSTQQLSLSGSGVGLAFTTIPIGSEQTRGGGQETAQLPRILYAPVAITAVDVGFNINDANGYVTTPVKLSPQLMASALTQTYRSDLPDYYPNNNIQGPAWSLSNPLNMTFDPLFSKLNTNLTPYATGNSVAPLLTEDHSAQNQQIWQWIDADPAAASWLDGSPDAVGSVTVNPDYQSLGLGKSAIDSFPRAYSPCLDLGTFAGPPPKEETKCSLDLLPYVSDYASAASTVLTANNTTTGQWSNFAVAPDGSLGWWTTNGTEPLGDIFMWGVSDTPDLASFGLIDAQLCKDDGTGCVGPSTASLTAAVSTAKPDSAGLLQVSPANVGAGAYPLTQVVYAAVPTNQSADALTAYADLIAYAAGAGQTVGVAPGDLPPGYLPLPASLKAQALATVNTLRADARGSQASPSTSSGTPGGTTPGRSGLTPAGSLNGSPSAIPTPQGGATPQPYNIRAPGAQLAASTTPRQPVGPIRWVLLTVVIAGAACAAGGTALRSARVPRWLHRARP